VSVQTHVEEVIQLPLSPEAAVRHENRNCDVTVTFSIPDLEAIWGAANERGCSIAELVKTAALEDAHR
jgi:hypothetical protein